MNRKIFMGFQRGLTSLLIFMICCLGQVQKEQTIKAESKDEKRIKFIEAALQSIPKKGELEEKTLSPYFFVLTDDPFVDQLPLKSTSAEVNISGIIAEVTITQVYKNEGKNVLEAIYIFPTSTRAAIYAMKMTIGKRVIEAKIKEREEARKEYEEARIKGRTASLLEQQRPNVFQMNVANILPGDLIKVEMSYTELLVPEDNLYEFVYPTVVGPRYSKLKENEATDKEKWVATPYLHEGEEATYKFGIKAKVLSGIPINEIYSPSHDIDVEYGGVNIAWIHLKESKKAGNRDFVLRYKLAGENIETGLLLYEGEEENFFLMMMEPPKSVISNEIVPREYIFIVDVSGSMHGFPLDISKKLLRDLISQLRPTDFFNVLLFAGGNQVLSEKSLPASEENLDKAIEVIERQRGGGGTELIPALKRALALPAAERASRIIVITTDGYVNVEKEAFELIRQNLNRANIFVFGIGSSVNRYLIEGMARAGMGESFVVLKQGEARTKANKFREYISSPLLQGINISYQDFRIYNVEPPTIPDLFAKRPLVVFGKFKGKPEGQALVTGSLADKKFQKVLEIRNGNLSDENSALRYLWARHRIMRLSDMNRLDKNDERVEEVTALGLKYNLMTEYTSFIAVDTEVRADGHRKVTVRQPLPLPQGVSDYALPGREYQSLLGKAPAPTADEMEYFGKEKIAKATVTLSIVEKEITVKGGLTIEQISRSLKINRSFLKNCYKQELSKDPSMSGIVKIKLTIMANGSVKEVSVQESTIKNAALEECLVDRLKSVLFPLSELGAESIAFFTLELKAKGR